MDEYDYLGFDDDDDWLGWDDYDMYRDEEDE